MNINSCFICKKNLTNLKNKQYFKCNTCGHELLDSVFKQDFITNDFLSIDSVRKYSLLDKYKNYVLSKFSKNNKNNSLLDIGSGSGRFLHQNKHKFSKCYGIEISPQSKKFSSEILHLNIFDSIKYINDEIDLVTAWHSLEHIPIDELILILKKLSIIMKPGKLFIISVPNVCSIQYKIFRTQYAFYDFPNHIHQFTPKSLELLLEQNNFVKLNKIISWPYNIFCMIQSILNIFNLKHNYLYYRLKRKTMKANYILDIYNLFLLIFILPIAIILSILELIFNNYESTITICFIKK